MINPQDHDPLSRDPLSQELRRSLAQRNLESANDPPCDADMVFMAEYLDGALDAAASQRFEVHLVGCSACRRLANDSAALVRPQSGTVVSFPSPRRSPRSWLSALAAGLAAVSVGWWWTASGPTEPSAPAADPAIVATSAEVDGDAADLERVLAGHLPEIAAFEALLDGEGRATMRHASAVRSPRPLSPRWTKIEASRPTFTWIMGSGSESSRAFEGEILLVDDKERLRARFPFQRSSGGPQSFIYPADRPPLRPGVLYAWKVNAQFDGELEASEYVPFQVAEVSAEDAQRIADLDQATQQAAAWAQLGYYEQALLQLSQQFSKQQLSIADGPAPQDPALLVDAIFERQRLPKALFDAERQRWGLETRPNSEGPKP